MIKIHPIFRQTTTFMLKSVLHPFCNSSHLLHSFNPNSLVFDYFVSNISGYDIHTNLHPPSSELSTSTSVITATVDTLRPFSFTSLLYSTNYFSYYEVQQVWLTKTSCFRNLNVLKDKHAFTVRFVIHQKWKSKDQALI